MSFRLFCDSNTRLKLRQQHFVIRYLLALINFETLYDCMMQPRYVVVVSLPVTFFFPWWRAPQKLLRKHRSLEAYCATLWWRWLVFSFFRVMEHRWTEIYRGKPKYSWKNLSQCHFVHHKSNMDWPGIEPEPPQWQPGDEPTAPWHGSICNLLSSGMWHRVLCVAPWDILACNLFLSTLSLNKIIFFCLRYMQVL
jgi:hypothetical protein